MPVLVRFLDVGQGNMALIQAGGFNVVCDCNIRDDNQREVLADLGRLLPASNRRIDAFINTHRDADHIAGIDVLNRVFPILRVWDSGSAGGSADSSVYATYMRVRRDVPEAAVLRAGETIPIGPATIRVLHGATESRPSDCNRESVVFKLEYCGNSVLFAGDCDTSTWKRIIAMAPHALDSSIFLAPHHGAIGCLEISGQPPYVPLTLPVRQAPMTLGSLAGMGGPPRPVALRSTSALPTLGQLARGVQGSAHYTEHLKLIRPYATVISVGAGNCYGHPSPEALRIYEQHTIGVDVSGRFGEAVKILRTDELGMIWVSLPDQVATSWTWYS